MDIERKKKTHSKRQSGPKVEKKKKNKGHNAKGFAIQHVNKAARTVRRALDLEEKKHHIPVVDRNSIEEPPVVVAVVGAKGVGKSTLISCLVKKLSGQRIREVKGPITVVANKKRRLTFFEVSTDIHAMVDAAKVADLVLLLVDAQFGKIEMEIFEFTQIVKIHPGQKVIGVMNHLEGLKDKKSLRKLKKRLKKRFWDEVYAGAKLFYMTHFVRGEYVNREVENLTRFISVMKYRPADWRQSHSYLLVDRMEDITEAEKLQQDANVERTVALYGFVRGAHLFAGCSAHIPGCGDISLDNITFLEDPCPSPGAKKRRSLLDKERKLYAPMCGVGDLLIDKGAVYVEMRTKKQGSSSQLKSLEAKKTQLPEEFRGSTEDVDEVDAEDMEEDDSEDMEEDDSEDLEEDDVEDMEDDSEDTEEDDVEDMEEDEEEEDEEHGVKGKRLTDRVAANSNKIAAQKADTKDVEKMKNAFDGLASLWKPIDVGRINWNQLVYGSSGKLKSKNSQNSAEADEDPFGDFLSVARDEANIEDRTLPLENAESRLDENAWDRLRNCFVTGTWDSKEDAQALLEADDAARANAEGSDEEEASESEEDIDEDDDPAANVKVYRKDRQALKAEKRQKYLEKKKRQREAFEAAYEAAKDAHSKNSGDSEYLAKWRAELAARGRRNREQFADVEEDVRVQLEGFRPGMYVRLEVRNMQPEFVRFFDPRTPLIVGSLLASEESKGFVRCNFKLHRWYGHILKSGDPVILSVGWRRFQSVMTYSSQDHNGRHRFVKYTPKHQHCEATFFGPLAPRGTGVLALPDCRAPKQRFRVCGTGGVEENDQLAELKKKLKLCGQPFKIFKKTAFVQGMFNSALEASKMVGAKVQTVSGIRGIIKKNLALTSKCPPGTVRVSFEDKIRYSDIVFCRCWAAVEPPKFCQTVTDLLLPQEGPDGERRQWQGLRTMGQLRQDLGLAVPQRPDSAYRDVHRPLRAEAPFVIPPRLQSRLPFKDKPKRAAPTAPNAAREVPEAGEQRREELLKMLDAVATDAAQRRRKSNLARGRKYKREADELRQQRQVLLKRAAKRRMAEKDKKERSAQRKGGGE